MNIGIDVEGDLDIQNGQLVLVGDLFATQQREIKEHIEQRLRTFFGEWFLDTTLGIPYLEEVFTKPVDVSFIESLFIQEILETPGVVRIQDFNMDLDKETRNLIVTPLRIESTAGVINFETLEI